VIDHGQYFHQYQSNEHPPLAYNNWTQNKTTTYGIENPGPGGLKGCIKTYF